MKIGNILEGTSFGKPQSVGNMMVIPITSETECTDVSEDMLFHISSDTNYSNLVLRNDSDRPIIVPQGTSYMNKQSAQDRAVLSANIIKAGDSTKVNVGCVESSQGGHMSRGTDEFTFIPATIRIPAINKDSTSHSKYDVLWKDIEKYLGESGTTRGRAHMRDFYTFFQKELEEFVASFESVKNQIGAVILINTEVVGIEIYPNYKSWKKVWRNLIRDSYGADAITLIKKKTVAAIKPLINIDNIESFEDLENEIVGIMSNVTEQVIKKVEPVLDQEMTEITINNVDDFTVDKISMGDFSGNLVKKSDKVIYVTAVRSLI